MSVERPDYALFDAPEKFQAIQSIVVRRLTEYPKAICSYSGGSDSDILIDLLERTRKLFNLAPIKYVYFDTGLEMQATKDHVQATAEKYGVEITTMRPKMNIVRATRKYGVPFMSKLYSQMMEGWRKKKIPLDIADEFKQAEDKVAKYKELSERYPNSKSIINWICGCDSDAKQYKSGQMQLDGHAYLREFLIEHPPDFKISAKCCYHCKKSLAHDAQKGFDLVITGEREAEGGVRTLNPSVRGCFGPMANTQQYRLRPLYYVTDADKAWYKEHYNIRYSDAYEVYGMKRTGCCGCPISYRAVEDLELIKQYEPNVSDAAWNIFGKSYEYRRMYNEYKDSRRAEESEGST